MYRRLTPALEQVATWLQGASQAVPISQLSFMTWVMFVISGSINLRSAFNISEQ